MAPWTILAMKASRAVRRPLGQGARRVAVVSESASRTKGSRCWQLPDGGPLLAARWRRVGGAHERSSAARTRLVRPCMAWTVGWGSARQRRLR